jgi:hypothetical protein
MLTGQSPRILAEHGRLADQLPIFEEDVVAGIAGWRSHQSGREVINRHPIPRCFPRFPPVGIGFTDLPGGSILFDELEGNIGEKRWSFSPPGLRPRPALRP